MNKTTRLFKRKTAERKLRLLITYAELCKSEGIGYPPFLYGALKHWRQEYRNTFTIWERILKVFGLTRYIVL